MVYKKKVILLSAFVFVLALVYFLTFALDPGNRRSEAFAWLDPSLLDMADRMEISGSGGAIALIRRNAVWLSEAGTSLYPVKQSRVEDLLGILTQKNIYPLRAVSSEGREKLGLGEGNASRIVIRGGAGLPLLDLLVGSPDALGREVFLKRADKNEIYSGEDLFTLYTESKPDAWYDLRLFPPDKPAVSFSLQAVQQAEVTFPAKLTEGGNGQKSVYTLRRRGDGWILVQDENAVLDSNRVEAWLRSVSEAEADDFASGTPAAIEGGVTLWLGDNTKRTVQIGPLDDNRWYATVQDSPLVYVFSITSIKRIFSESSAFLKN